MTRRSFLVRFTALIGGLIGAAIAGVSGTYFIAPLWSKKKDSWIDLGNAQDFLQKEPRKIEFTIRKHDAWTTIEGKSAVWVVSKDPGHFVAYNPKCTHLGCPYNWNSEKKQFLCPCHAAVFGIDGRVISGPPPRPLDQYPTKIEDGRLFIRHIEKHGQISA